MTSFTLRQDKTYRAEIKMGSGGGMVPNSMIAKHIQPFGFVDVSVVGSGRYRIAEGNWLPKEFPKIGYCFTSLISVR
jgi:hypothetical protein